MAGGAERFLDNPFYVLGLGREATRAEAEREGQKLLGMLELGLSSARTYETPAGPGVRTPDKVRRAMAELRDPERRLAHELWVIREERPAVASSPDDEVPAEPASGAPSHATAPWREAHSALGFAPRGGRS